MSTPRIIDPQKIIRSRFFVANHGLTFYKVSPRGWIKIEPVQDIFGITTISTGTNPVPFNKKTGDQLISARAFKKQFSDHQKQIRTI